MPLTITIKKPEDLRSALIKAKHDANKHNIVFEGNERSGNGSGYGFKGSYKVYSDSVEITVQKKPPVITKSKIEKAIEKYCGNL